MAATMERNVCVESFSTLYLLVGVTDRDSLNIPKVFMQHSTPN